VLCLVKTNQKVLIIFSPKFKDVLHTFSEPWKNYVKIIDYSRSYLKVKVSITNLTVWITKLFQLKVETC